MKVKNDTRMKVKNDTMKNKSNVVFLKIPKTTLIFASGLNQSFLTIR